MINITNNNIVDIAVESTPIEKAYIGSQLVWENSSLPYDAEIEYLESDGNQWIDTGIKNWGTSISVETKMAFTDLTVSRMLEGTNNRFYYGLNANRYELDYNQYWGTADTNYHVFKKTLSKSSSTATKYNLQVWIDGTSRRSQSNMSNPANAVTGNVFIFGSSSGTSIGLKMKCRKTYYKLSVNGVLVRDMVPVRVGQVGCLYDKISKTLFYNQGTIDFILGPDVT